LNNHRLSPLRIENIFALRKQRSSRTESDKCMTPQVSASSARGFTRASIFTGDGRLVASTAQEGLMRTTPNAPLERTI